jgi:hypothetical protein
MGRGIVCALVAVAVLAPGARADHDGYPAPPGYTEHLPGLSEAQQPQPGPVRGCRKLRLRCLKQVVARLDAIRARFGCDHRALFATTYRIVTEEARVGLKREPGLIDDHRWLVAQDVIFARYYFRALRRFAADRPVAPAWQIALDATQADGVNGGQDLLLGINAHVQNDQAFVIAAIGLNTPDGRSRKPDHEAFNTILSRAYDPIVAELGARYDPMLTLADGGPSPLDDWGGLELVRTWRELVWRNAERLVEARDKHERAQVADQIEANAAAWAAAIAAGEFPGYRAQRDAYCAANVDDHSL